MTTIETTPVYKQIIADSFGGVMYDVGNRGKYDATEILKLWDEMTQAEQDNANGIIKGAINFLKEYEV